MAGIGRRQVFEVIEAGQGADRLSRAVDVFLIALISLNVLAVVLESVAAIRAELAAAFEAFEAFSVVIFTVEYGVRLWSIVEHDDPRFRHPLWGRLRHAVTPMALIDVFAIAPFYLAFLVGVDLRFLRIVRLFRILKLTRYSSSMALLVGVLRKEAQPIGAALFVLLLLIVLAASITYLAEHAAQPEAFSSIPAAMWWAVITMTSVGYGDVVPVTPLGRLCAGVIAIISIGMVALPAGLLASGFSEALHRRREQYRKLVGEVLEDGVITSDEAEALHDGRESLGLSRKEAQRLVRAGLDEEERRRREAEYEALLAGALADGILADDEKEMLRRTRDALGISAHDAHKILTIWRRHRPAGGATACPHCGKPLGEAAE